MSTALVATLPAIAFYCFVQGITPGPANLCSLATTMRYGIRPAMRQWLGLTLGFYVVSFAAVACAWGAGAFLQAAIPWVSAVGAGYILWLAWSMARPAEKAHAFEARPTVRAGFLLQVTNAKILVACVTALFSFVLPYTADLAVLLGIGLLLPVIGVSCNLVWIAAGARLQGFYEAHRRPVDLVMAASLAACAAGMLVSALGGGQ